MRGIPKVAPGGLMLETAWTAQYQISVFAV